MVMLGSPYRVWLREPKPVASLLLTVALPVKKGAMEGYRTLVPEGQASRQRRNGNSCWSQNTETSYWLSRRIARPLGVKKKPLTKPHPHFVLSHP